MNTNLQAFSVEISPGQTGWIQLVPAGRNVGHDGRGPYILNNAAAVIAASKREKTDLFIDRDHQTVFMPRGTEVVAAGWIKGMEARADGVWGLVEWTEKASAQLAAKEYRYISPVFKVDPATGEITQIMHASLTNNPNFELTAVASADVSLNPTLQEKRPMEEFLKKLAALLGLAETATADEVVAALTERLQALQTASAEITTIRSALKLDEKADAKTVVTAMSALVVAGADKKPDPAQYVPMSAFDDVKKELAEIRKGNADRTAAESVEAACRSGKISPAMKGWALEYASSDLTGFNKYIENAPAIVTASASNTGGQPGKDGDGLSDEASKAVRSMGLDPKDVEKSMKA